MQRAYKIPEFVTHYYRGRPFRTLTELGRDERALVIDGLDYPPEAMPRFRSEYYFEQRLRYEQLMFEQFIAKGGRPTRTHPHYAILGESEIWAETTTHALRIPISAVPSVHISFTYTDSWVTYVDREPNGQAISRKPQYGMLFRFEELEDVFDVYGWPGDRWKLEVDWGNDLYVEAQIWSDQALHAFLPKQVDSPRHGDLRSRNRCRTC